MPKNDEGLIQRAIIEHLRIRADTHTFSLVELPLALGLFFASPEILIVSQMLGAGAALAVHRRQGPLKPESVSDW